MTMFGALVAGGLGILTSLTYQLLTEDDTSTAEPGTEPKASGDSGQPPADSDDTSRTEPQTEIVRTPEPPAYEVRGRRPDGGEAGAGDSDEQEPDDSAVANDEPPADAGTESADGSPAPEKSLWHVLGRHPLSVLAVGVIGVAVLYWGSLRFLASPIESGAIYLAVLTLAVLLGLGMGWWLARVRYRDRSN